MLLQIIILSSLACISNANVPRDYNYQGTCTCTVPVQPDVDSNACNNEDLDALKDHLDNQNLLLSQQLSTVVDKLNELIEDKEGESEEGNGTQTVNGVGTTYVHWGKTSCPETAELIYDGKLIYD